MENTLTRLLGELEDVDGSDVESLIPYLRHVVQSALGDRSGEEETSETAEAPPALDRPSAQLAIKALHRLELSLLHAALISVSASSETAVTVERIFKALSGAEQELLSRLGVPNAQRGRAELLAEVFHDLKSPLTTIMFLADALHSGQSGELSDTQTEQIRIIYSASLTLLTLAENVLSSRNIEKGDLEPEFLPFSLGATLDEVERITRPLADQYGLEIEFRRDCISGRVGDPDALRRILLNLVTNALSYTEEGGVTVQVMDEEGDLLVRVEDTGPGMNEDKLADLFTPPYRDVAEGERSGDRKGSRRFSQAGLGLSICHRLAVLVGGEIDAESELGQGTAFTVRLPFPVHQ